MSPGQLNFLWIATTGTCLLLAAALLYRGLRWDPSRIRRRCPKCWYDMHAVAGLRCPECGKEAKSERALFRTRRKWKLALGGPLLVVALSIAISIWFGRLNGWRFAPDILLAYTVSPTGNSLSSYAVKSGRDAELDRRLRAGILSDLGWRILLTRAFAASPPIDAILSTRTHWPADVPLAIGGRLDESNSVGWIHYPHSPRLTLFLRLLTTPSGAPGEWTALVDDQGVFVTSFEPVPIGLAKPGAKAVEVELRLTVGTSYALWKGKRYLPVDVSGSIGSLLSPQDSNEAAAVLNGMRPSLLLSPSIGWIQIVDPCDEPGYSDNDYAVGLRARVLFNSEVVATGEYWSCPPMASRAMMHGPGDSATGVSDMIALKWSKPVQQLRSAPGKWELELTDDSTLALRDFDWTGRAQFFYNNPPRPNSPPWHDPTKYWSGTFRRVIVPERVDPSREPR